MTTATEWLAENPEDVEALGEMLMGVEDLPIRLWTEIPRWMKEEIAAQLEATFAQPYWDDIAKTTLGDAEAALEEGLREGWSIRKIAGEMRESLGGDRYAKVRSLNIARTEAGNALNGARKASLDRLQAEVGDSVPMRQTWLSVLGNTTRDTHASLDGVPAGEDGTWKLAGIKVPWPSHFWLPAKERCNCFPAGMLVSGKFIGAQRAWYDGAMTEIVFRSGRRVTMTPNHPVVTSDGLVPAGKLDPGQQVLAYGGKVDPPIRVAPGGDQVQDEPLPIEQVFELFLARSVSGVNPPVEVMGAEEDDFNGDGKFVDGHIEVVRAYGKLLGDPDPVGNEEFGDLVFSLVDDGGSSLELGGSSAAFGSHGIGRAPAGGPGSGKGLLDMLGGLEVSPSGFLTVGIASDFDSSLLDSASKDGPAIASFLRDAKERFAGFVSFDDVVEVRNFHFSHWVYDLQSVYGTVMAYDPLYIDNGIVTSNCQCSLTVDFGIEESTARELIQAYYDRDESDIEGKAAGAVAVAG